MIYLRKSFTITMLISSTYCVCFRHQQLLPSCRLQWWNALMMIKRGDLAHYS